MSLLPGDLVIFDEAFFLVLNVHVQLNGSSKTACHVLGTWEEPPHAVLALRGEGYLLNYATRIMRRGKKT